MWMFCGRNVDVVEERLVHPAVVAVRVVRRHRVVFVEVERDDPREIEPGFLVQADQFAVEADRRRAGRQPEHGRPAGRVVLANQALDHQRDVPRRLRAGGEDERGNFGVRNVVRDHGRSRPAPIVGTQVMYQGAVGQRRVAAIARLALD